MEFVTVTKGDLADQHLCCALSGKCHNAGVAAKKSWMAGGIGDGLVFRKADVRGKVFIEYMPADLALKPVRAPDSLMIHCLWVSGRYKAGGLGRDLLRHCTEDARESGYRGIAVVAGAMPFLTPPAFFSHFGFETVERTVSGFELMFLDLKGGVRPSFFPLARAERIEAADGVVIQASPQCPFSARQMELHEAAVKAMGLGCRTQILTDHRDMRQAGSPFGSYGVFLNGCLISHEMSTPAALVKKLEKAMGSYAMRNG